MRTITVFKGDGIGPEIVDAVLQILRHHWLMNALRLEKRNMSATGS